MMSSIFSLLVSLSLVLSAFADFSVLQSELTAIKDGRLSFAVSNPTAENVEIPIHLTPFGANFDIQDDIFEVFGPQGQPVEYVGMLARRIEEEAEIFVVPAGATYIKNIDISMDYAFMTAGTYKVSWRFGVAKSVDISVVEPLGDRRFGANVTVQAPNNFQGCTANERTQVLAADVTATSDCRLSYTCLNQGTCPQAYLTWFGARTDARYTRTTSNFLATRNEFDRGNYRIFCNPAGCPANTYAYVFPTDRTHVVYLCSVFWRLPSERAETLVHELTHFNDVASTRDFAYGQNPCKNLARTNPANAIANADNLCYFARGYTF